MARNEKNCKKNWKELKRIKKNLKTKKELKRIEKNCKKKWKELKRIIRKNGKN